MEKLVNEILNQINNLKSENTSWKATFSKFINDSNKKFFIDELEILERQNKIKSENLLSKLEKLLLDCENKIEEVLIKFTIFFIFSKYRKKKKLILNKNLF